MVLNAKSHESSPEQARHVALWSHDIRGSKKTNDELLSYVYNPAEDNSSTEIDWIPTICYQQIARRILPN